VYVYFWSYFADHLTGIHELPQKNSGMRTGRFLEPSRIPKPDCNPATPCYYGITDFCIGSIITGTIYRNILWIHILYQKLWGRHCMTNYIYHSNYAFDKITAPGPGVWTLAKKVLVRAILLQFFIQIRYSF